MLVEELPEFQRQAVERSINTNSRADADLLLSVILETVPVTGGAE